MESAKSKRNVCDVFNQSRFDQYGLLQNKILKYKLQKVLDIYFRFHNGHQLEWLFVRLSPLHQGFEITSKTQKLRIIYL